MARLFYYAHASSQGQRHNIGKLIQQLLLRGGRRGQHLRQQFYRGSAGETMGAIFPVGAKAIKKLFARNSASQGGLFVVRHCPALFPNGMYATPLATSRLSIIFPRSMRSIVFCTL